MTTTVQTGAPPERQGMTKRQRTTFIRSGQYAIIVVIIALLAIVGHWNDFRLQFLDFHSMGQILPRVLKTGLINTLLYTVMAFIFGLVVGLIVALMRMSEVRLYRWIATVYVELLRGLPTLLVLFLLNYAIPTLFGPSSKIFSNFYLLVTVGLGSVAAAYMSETIRAGVQAVPKGQMEAARTLGMSRGQAMRLVILPQAFRIIIPPMTNEIILLIKDSSLVYALSFTATQYDLTYLTQTAASGGISGIAATASPLLLAGIAYLVVTLPLSQAVRALERKQAKRR
ncbi:polar amino acid transport system permease protein [Nakamurella sp. UYEF19]|uniref:amino acid ABC transporter permease n=1 Tax=Nakamurella sp. UYEF19 TaxID=1756392 RepID=UPI00339B0941